MRANKNRWRNFSDLKRSHRQARDQKQGNLKRNNGAFADALAELADLLGKTADAVMLRQRAKQLGTLINTHMWMPSLSVYSNLLTNGTLYPRIAPTSFYPLLAGLASTDQAQVRKQETEAPFFTGAILTDNSGHLSRQARDTHGTEACLSETELKTVRRFRRLLQPGLRTSRASASQPARAIGRRQKAFRAPRWVRKRRLSQL